MDRMDIFQLVQEFYAMEALSAMLLVNQNSRFLPLRHSHERWYRDFSDFRSKYIAKFSAAIFDYTALVVAAELRHGRKKASHYLKAYYDSELERGTVYDDCSVYAAKDILAAGISMFNEKCVKWDKGYGGDKWKQIAKAGLMKDKVNDCVFIDHCVDLSHNNSIYFDKGAGIFVLHSVDQYQTFLDFKRCCVPQDLIVAGHGSIFRRLLSRAAVLDLVEQLPHVSICACETSESTLLDYRPVEWGSKRLDYSERNIAPSIHLCIGCRRREYDCAQCA